jgi:hypothetical protein
MITPGGFAINPEATMAQSVVLNLSPPKVVTSLNYYKASSSLWRTSRNMLLMTTKLTSLCATVMKSRTSEIPVPHLIGSASFAIRSLPDSTFIEQTQLNLKLIARCSYAKGNLARHVREKHERLNSAVKYPCSMCSRSYNRRDAQRKHEWKKHKIPESQSKKRERPMMQGLTLIHPL